MADAADRSAVQAEQVALLYRLAPASLISSVVVAALVWLVLRGVADIKHLTLWLFAVCALTLGRYLLTRAYRRQKVEPGLARDWALRFMIGAVISGMLWGYMATVLLPIDQPQFEVALAFIIAGMATGGMVSLAPVRWAYPAFLLPFLLPFAVHQFSLAGPPHLYIAIASLIYIAGLLTIGEHIHRTIVAGLAMRFRVNDLSERLSAANKQSDKTKRELTSQTIERVRAEVEAKDQRLRLDLLIQHTPLACVEWNPDLTIKEWNPAAEVMFGYARIEAIGKPGIELIVPPELREWTHKFIGNVMRGAGSPHGTFKNVHKSGRTLAVEWYNTALHNPGAQANEIVSLCLDVTERFEIERMKDKFIATVTHELRTPLTAVSGALRLLASGVAGSANDEAQKLIAMAERNSRDLLKAVDDVITLAKFERAHYPQDSDSVSVALLVHQAIAQARDYAGRFGVTIELAESAADARVSVDVDQMIKTLVLLICNAALHSRRDATVDIAIERASLDAIRVIVKDHGAGIAPELRDRVFADFSLLDPLAARGLGAGPSGLGAAKAIVERYGGSLGFTSQPNVGTTFLLVLPVGSAPV